MRVLIVGAGRVRRLLAAELLHHGHDVRILDASEERLGELRRLRDHADAEGRPDRMRVR